MHIRPVHMQVSDVEDASIHNFESELDVRCRATAYQEERDQE